MLVKFANGTAEKGIFFVNQENLKINIFLPGLNAVGKQKKNKCTGI
jgi:hypothetical protein